MNDATRKDGSSVFDRLKPLLSGLPWLKIVEGAWKIIQTVAQSQSYAGMYEVLNYESTLELKDRGGKTATFKKREKVRYVRDSVRARATPYLALAALDVYALWRFILPALT